MKNEKADEIESKDEGGIQLLVYPFAITLRFTRIFPFSMPGRRFLIHTTEEWSIPDRRTPWERAQRYTGGGWAKC